MGRIGVYLKDKIEREVRDIVQKELNNGASPAEVSVSSTCNELIRLGLLVYKNNDSGGPKFDLEGYRRDLIMKASGSREGIMILTALVCEMYVQSKGNDAQISLEDLINQSISAINQAETATEAHHFLTNEE